MEETQKEIRNKLLDTMTLIGSERNYDYAVKLLEKLEQTYRVEHQRQVESYRLLEKQFEIKHQEAETCAIDSRKARVRADVMKSVLGYFVIENRELIEKIEMLTEDLKYFIDEDN